MLISRRAARWAALCLLLSLLIGCFAEAAPAFPLSFTDCTGHTVTLEKQPETVCVLFSSFAEIWNLAGGEVAVTVGESVERGFAPASAILVDENAGHSVIDLETLVMARPDLVIGTADYACQKEAVEFCRSVGIPAALMRVESFADYLYVLETFCLLTDRDDLFVAHGLNVQARIEALFERLEAEKGVEPARILFLRAGSSARSTKAKATADHFACQMLSELGAQNIADGDSPLTGDLSLEIILREDPDYLFVSLMGDEAAARDYVSSLLRTDGWQALGCVQAGNVCFLPKEYFHFKPNARWAEAYEMLAAILYPALMP